MTRYNFLQQGTKTVIGAAMLPGFIGVTGKQKTIIKAVAFDAYALFDTHIVLDVLEQLFPGKSIELMKVWRSRQFEYTWLRIIERKYQDFWQITGDALVYAGLSLHLDLVSEKKERIMQAVRGMRFVPEAANVLKQLKDLSLQLAILSNATPDMLVSGINQSNLQGVFDFVLSTDSIKTYKPDPLAYQLAINSFQVKKEEILFVAFGGWDAAGAKTFGYHTAWINAASLPNEELSAVPDFTCKNLAAIPGYVKNINGKLTH